MCLAVPVKIKSISGSEALVDADGIEKKVSLMLLEEANPGDYVLLHAGFAIQKLNKKEAMDSLKAWEELKNLDEIS